MYGALVNPLETLRVSVTYRALEELPGLTAVTFALRMSDYEAFDEFEASEWLVCLDLEPSVPRRKTFSAWQWDDSPFEDCLPFASLVVPNEKIVDTRLRVEGWIDQGAEQRTSFVYEFRGPVEELRFEVDESFVSTLRADSTALESPRLGTVSLPGAPFGPSPVAVLPAEGLLFAPKGKNGHVFHSSSACRALTFLDELLASLPGRPDATPPLYVGGPRGRMAVHILRRGVDTYDDYRPYVFLIDIGSEDIVQVAETSHGTLATEVGGVFDDEGETYACVVRPPPRTQGSTTTYSTEWIGVSTSDGALRKRWRTGLASAGERMEFIGEALYFADFRGRSCKAGESEATTPMPPLDGQIAAYHPGPRLHARLIDHRGAAEQFTRLDVHHPERGTSSFVLPTSAHAESLAVLPNGLIVVGGEPSILVDAAKGRMQKLADVLVPARLHFSTMDATTWMWTRDAATFGVALP